ncbi:hypothetical protein TD95_003963 [Thielaviopsis punctulata]|uniref:Mmc protein n=1 Tax=Thielaviopsis punctulata TaxID=72032 RepID=A0A0F4Z7U5_9PEZI|nr:hypothetical protein TD95_003963 [Thielaviopsis punctulata]
MKFSASVLVAASAVAAQTGVSNVTYVTDVVTAYTTFCPEATVLTYGGKTYSVTEATTLTITDCPCTVSKPVYTSSYVACSTCTPAANGTVPTPAPAAGTGSYSHTASYVPTGSYVPTPSAVTAGAGKAIAVSGAGLAGVLAVALAL